MRVVFCGGGTGGHVTPAIAIADALSKEYPSCQIYFIGRSGGRENTLIESAGYTLHTVKIEGLKRRFSMDVFKTLEMARRARAEAREILEELHPDAVIGTGGYVSWPSVSAAQSLNIPTAIHESNAVLGLSASLLSRKCDILLLGMDIKTKLKNALFVGNPVRKEFKEVSRNKSRRTLGIPDDKIFILSVGGSGGAKSLNNECIRVMKSYSATNEEIMHIHSSGKGYYEELKLREAELCKGYNGCKIVPFIDDMATYLASADIVVSRCGAMSLTEIAYIGTPAILIPSPNVAGNHQLRNAEFFSNKGAAVLLEEEKIDHLEIEIDRLAKSKTAREQMSIKVKKSANRSADINCVNALKKIMNI